MMGSLYAALKEANVTDLRAKAAAEEIAGYQGHFKEIRTEIADLKSTLRLRSCMLGVNTAMILAILLRVFWP